jgi:hypothetical protein
VDLRRGDPLPGQRESQKISGYGAGAVEYHLELPKGLQLDGVSGLLLMAELSSGADGERLDWPARYRDQARRHHPQTDTRKWPTDLTVLVNGVPVATQTLPDDPADARGVLSHHRGLHPGTYGQLATLMVEGDRLAQVLKAAENDRIIRVRFEVPESAAHRGGLAIFGETMGRYTVEPACLIALRHPHGLTPGDSSDKHVATHRFAIAGIFCCPVPKTPLKTGITRRQTAGHLDASRLRRGDLESGRRRLSAVPMHPTPS